MITYAMKSMTGDREHNEDYVRIYEKNDAFIFALADGLGGGSCGEVASRIAVESIEGRLGAHREVDFLEQVFTGAQEAVLGEQEQRPEAGDMSTTLVVLLLDGGHAQWAHIGDSRLYRFHRWFLKSRTLDHSVPQMLVNMGELKPDQIRHHADRSRLLNVIGKAWDRPEYEVSDKVPLRKGDAFLLCTDGFWEYITEKEMLRCLFRASSAEEWLARMGELVRKNGKDADMDNYSAICVKVG